jgi:uncharacterized protein (DUF885 family)/mannose-6-phosphate isomerase-like protein (cupin superfamily)
MKRLAIIFAVGAVVGISAQGEAPPPAQSVSNFFRDFTADWIRANPNQAASTRYFSGAEQDRFEEQLSPETPEFRHNRVLLAQKGLNELAGFDRARMTDTERVSAELMQWQLSTLVEGEKYQDYVFPLEQFGGVNVNLPSILTVNHPLVTEKDAVHYVARLGQVGMRMDEAIAEARALIAKKMFPPRFIVRATITQMRGFIATPPAKNPFVTAFADRMAAAKSIPDARREELRAQAERIVATQVFPAWRRGLAILEPLVGRATDDAGLWRFKGGDEAYAYSLRRFTTTNLTAEEIHQIGLKRVAAIEQQMEGILKRLGRTEGPLKDRIKAIEKSQSYPLTEDGRKQIMADTEQILRDAEKRAALQFDVRPKAPVVAQPYPRFREANAAASYSAPAPDGSRPGTFQIPLRPERMTKYTLRTLVYHETVPGHHFQIALEMENRSLPRFRRVRAFGGISALSEGWGLYAERLAAESGWYDNDLEGQLGQLDMELFRAKRLVVDTGIHAKHWTRQQAIDYGIEASEIERYVVNPGQACSYMMGELRILELRDKAKKALGDRFSIKEFHNAVLSTGTVPLDVLERQVDAYLKSALIVASLPKGESVVPVYHEPHHRMVFAYGTTKILDAQVSPGETSWYHTHTEPVLYITLSQSQQRTQLLGQEMGAGRGAAPAGRGAAPAGRGNAPPAAGRGTAPANGAPGGPPAAPAIRATSTTSYYDEPITHRITNAGDRLFRFMVVTNASAGDQNATETGAGFPGKPELSNRWFRAYRLTLAPGQATEPHRHTTESVIFQISDGKALAVGPMTFELYEQGRWAWFDDGKTHEIRNVGTVPVEFIEVEVRKPAAP